MDPFFGRRGWYHQPDPARYGSPSFRGVPVHRVDPWETSLHSYPTQPPVERNPTQKVVRIPVQFVGSKKVDRPGSALKIQKVFRGFLVRKWLKKIKDIKAQVDAIEEKLGNGDVVDLVRKDEKERLRMNESLMSLLIQLDSVSGLDFGVRACRKAVIRKAIALQEKIDAIVAGDSKEGGENSEAVDQEKEIQSSAEVDSSNQSNRNHANCGTVNQEAEINPPVDVDSSNQPIEPEKPNDSLKNDEQSDKFVQHNEDLDNGGGGGDKLMEVEWNDAKHDATDVGVEREVKVGEANPIGDANQSPDAIASTAETVKEEDSFDDGDNKRNRELLERMMEENEKMMSMMKQLFERNEAQTHVLNALTQRVEALEKALVCDRQKKKKKKQCPPTTP